MTLRDYADVLKKWWKIIAVLAVVGLVAGGIFSLVTTSKYEATAQLYVSIPTSDSATELNQAATYLSRELKSYATVASSPYVLGPMIEDTGLNRSVSDVSDMVEVTNPTATSIIQINATAESPAEAQEIANGVADQLIKGVASLSPEVANRTGAVRAEVLSRAQQPTKPSGIPSLVYPAAGLVLGALLGVVLAFVLDSLIRRPRTLHELRSVQGASLTATVPRLKQLSDALSFDPAAIEQSGAAQPSPYVTTLRSRLQQRHAQVLPQVDGCATFVVTGSHTGDGTSTVALELARSFAALGSRVALLDAHLSDRGLTNLLAQQDRPGVSDLLERRAGVDRSAVQLEPGLTFLPAGSPTGRASDLVCSEDMVSLLRELRAEFDVVIVDCSPLDESADAPVLGELADEVLLVTVPGRVGWDQLETGVAGFREVPVSLVANKVRSARGHAGLV